MTAVTNIDQHGAVIPLCFYYSTGFGPLSDVVFGRHLLRRGDFSPLLLQHVDLELERARLPFTKRLVFS